MALPFLLFTPYPLEPSLHLYTEPPPTGPPNTLLLVVNTEEKLTVYCFPSCLSPQQPLPLFTSIPYSFLLKLYIPSTDCRYFQSSWLHSHISKRNKTLVTHIHTHTIVYLQVHIFSYLIGKWSQVVRAWTQSWDLSPGLTFTD